MTNSPLHQRTRHETEYGNPKETTKTVDKLRSVVQNAGLYRRQSQGTDIKAGEQFTEPVTKVSPYTLSPCDGRFPIALRFIGCLEIFNQHKHVSTSEAR